MAENSKIEWTHHTFSPWRGCTKVSDGCKNCYAEQMSGRNHATLGTWGPGGERVIGAESYWRQPLTWNAAAARGQCRDCRGYGILVAPEPVRPLEEPMPDSVETTHCSTCQGTGRVDPYRARVFCASLADVFEGQDTMPEESWEPVRAARRRLFGVIQNTSHLDWLLLTKRPENVMPMLSREPLAEWNPGGPSLADGMPWRNVWIGTSVEDQVTADKRIPHLLKIPAAVRFLSCEPLLGLLNLNLRNYAFPFSKWRNDDGSLNDRHHEIKSDLIHWVIAGGESGPNARPMHPEWARSLRDQCAEAGVPFLFKQWGEWQSGSAHPTLQKSVAAKDTVVLLDGRTYSVAEWNVPATFNRVMPGRTSAEMLPTIMSPVGKKAAGRLLDGRLYDGYPKGVR